MVHGDDITSDSSGEDCYRYVKAAHRFKVVTRTPGISTTDLVGRMLLCTKDHFIKSLVRVLDGRDGQGSPTQRNTKAQEMKQRIMEYATDESGLKPGVNVWLYNVNCHGQGLHFYQVDGKTPRPGQRVVYVDGGFDLFSSGHIEFLRQVTKLEEDLAKVKGWYEADTLTRRVRETGEDYGPAYVIAGVHEDEVINHWKGVNYPIMNIYERALCVLQCRVRLVQSFDTLNPLCANRDTFSLFTALFSVLHLLRQSIIWITFPMACPMSSITAQLLSCPSPVIHILRLKIWAFFKKWKSTNTKTSTQVKLFSGL